MKALKLLFAIWELYIREKNYGFNLFSKVQFAPFPSGDEMVTKLGLVAYCRAQVAQK